jgi:hypothetical protein
MNNTIKGISKAIFGSQTNKNPVNPHVFHYLYFPPSNESRLYPSLRRRQLMANVYPNNHGINLEIFPKTSSSSHRAKETPHISGSETSGRLVPVIPKPSFRRLLPTPRLLRISVAAATPPYSSPKPPITPKRLRPTPGNKNQAQKIPTLPMRNRRIARVSLTVGIQFPLALS